MFYRLNDDNCVIHNQANRKHQAEERERIDGKSKNGEEDESPDQRDWHCQEWDERRSPSLQEQEYDKDNERDRNKQRKDDLFNSLHDRAGRIQSQREVHVLGKAGLELCHELLYAVRRVNRIRAGELIHGDDRARLSVQPAGYRIVLGTEFDSRDILHAYCAALGRLANHNLSKFFGGNQSSLSANSISELLAGRNRLSTYLAGRIHSVLGLDCIYDFRHRYLKLRELVRLHPKSHCVLAGSEDLHLPDARRPRNGIHHVDVRVVG